MTQQPRKRYFNAEWEASHSHPLPLPQAPTVAHVLRAAADRIEDGACYDDGQGDYLRLLADVHEAQEAGR